MGVLEIFVLCAGDIGSLFWRYWLGNLEKFDVSWRYLMSVLEIFDPCPGNI